MNTRAEALVEIENVFEMMAQEYHEQGARYRRTPQNWSLRAPGNCFHDRCNGVLERVLKSSPLDFSRLTAEQRNDAAEGHWNAL
jgi:hypothetical protein